MSDKDRILERLKEFAAKDERKETKILCTLTLTGKSRCRVLRATEINKILGDKNLAALILKYRDYIAGKTLRVTGKSVDFLDGIVSDLHRQYPRGTDVDILIEALLMYLVSGKGKYTLKYK